MKATEFEDPFEILEAEMGPCIDLRPPYRMTRPWWNYYGTGIAVGMLLGFMAPVWLMAVPFAFLAGWFVYEIRQRKTENQRDEEIWASLGL